VPEVSRGISEETVKALSPEERAGLARREAPAAWRAFEGLPMPTSGTRAYATDISGIEDFSYAPARTCQRARTTQAVRKLISRARRPSRFSCSTTRDRFHAHRRV